MGTRFLLQALLQVRGLLGQCAETRCGEQRSGGEDQESGGVGALHGISAESSMGGSDAQFRRRGLAAKGNRERDLPPCSGLGQEDLDW